MRIIYEARSRAGSNLVFRAGPGREVVVMPERKIIREVRWHLEPCGENDHTIMCVKITRNDDGSIDFINDPISTRYAYLISDRDGKTTIEGDINLWNRIEENIGNENI